MKTKNLLLTMIAIVISIGAMAQVPSYVPTNGLVGWWGFNGNANDASGNNNNGTNNGATLTPDRFGNVNSAYSFNGVSNYINGSFINPINTSLTGVTFSGWSLMNSTLTLQTIINVTSTNGAGYGITTAQNNFSGLCGQPNVGADMQITGSNNPNLNTWYHVVLSCDLQTNNSKLYVNGTLQSKSTSPITQVQLANYTIGIWGGGNWAHDGKLDDIGIWNRALTQQEITGLYNGTTTTCTDTVHVTVTDTLIINRTMTNLNPLTYQNTIKIYPNPANNVLNMNFGNNYLALNGYTLKITNSLSQTVYTTPINSQNTNVNISPWANGIYFVHLIDVSNNIVDIKKIVIQ